MTSVGVVVLTMGSRPDELRRGLESLLAQEDVELDIVCVGNGWQPVLEQGPHISHDVILPTRA